LAPEPVSTLWRRERSLSPAGNRTLVVQPSAYSPPIYRRNYPDTYVATYRSTILKFTDIGLNAFCFRMVIPFCFCGLILEFWSARDKKLYGLVVACGLWLVAVGLVDW
jgi:hypothetical protein